jgi:hypothetical protein
MMKSIAITQLKDRVDLIFMHFFCLNLLDHVIHISLHILIINMSNITMLCFVGSYVPPIVVSMMHNKVQHCHSRIIPWPIILPIVHLCFENGFIFNMYMEWKSIFALNYFAFTS